MNYNRWCDDTLTDKEWYDIIENHTTNYYNYCDRELQRISTLDEKDRTIQFRQLTRIMDAMLKLEEMEIQRNKNQIKKQLQDGGVVSLECPYSSDELNEQWKQNFLKGLSQQDREDCYISSYLWWAFTYEKITDYITGDDAIKAFDSENKNKIYIWGDSDDTVSYLDTNNKLCSNHLRIEKRGRNMFIMDQDFTWTYIYKQYNNESIWYKPKSNL